jgi:hypothetical protein
VNLPQSESVTQSESTTQPEIVTQPGGGTQFKSGTPSESLTEPEASTNTQLKDFTYFLLNRVPVHLIPLADRTLLGERFNERLQDAKDQDIELREIEIGDDCLPTWPGWNWDPEVKSLNIFIQERLSAITASTELGNFLRTDIISKFKRRLDEAVALGIPLRYVTIGPEDLLLQWPEHEAQLQSVVEGDETTPVAESGYFSRETTVGAATGLGLLPPSSLFSSTSDEYVSPELDVNGPDQKSQDADMTDTSFAAHKNQYECEDDENKSVASSLPSWLEPDSSTEGSDDDRRESSPVPNIVHDVEMFDEDGRLTSIDLEAYLADDSDLDSIPEAELAIDRESYEYYFDVTEAQDFELPPASPGTTASWNRHWETMAEVSELTREEQLMCNLGIHNGWIHRGMSKRTQVKRMNDLIAAHRLKAADEESVLRQQREQSSESPDEEEMIREATAETESVVSEEGVTTDEDEEVPRQQQNFPVAAVQLNNFFQPTDVAPALTDGEVGGHLLNLEKLDDEQDANSQHESQISTEADDAVSDLFPSDNEAVDEEDIGFEDVMIE